MIEGLKKWTVKEKTVNKSSCVNFRLSSLRLYSSSEKLIWGAKEQDYEKTPAQTLVCNTEILISNML
jgi:hypothetical protein